MTAGNVIILPYVWEKLIEQALNEVAKCELDIEDLQEGRALPAEFGHEFTGRDGRDLALEALEIKHGLAVRNLERLLEEAGD